MQLTQNLENTILKKLIRTSFYSQNLGFKSTILHLKLKNFLDALLSE